MKKVLVILSLGVLLTSCGSPRSVVKVKNMAEGVQTTISTNVGAGGSTTVTVTPNAQISVPDENE